MFSFNDWREDAQASLVVFLVALPLCLGIALASGAPLAAGLISGIIGGIVVGGLSGSQISIAGPAAGFTIIVSSAIHDLGSFEAFTLAVLISGILQILFGILRGGIIGNYFPSSVIKGMLAAIGIILILKQLPHAFGYDADYMGDESFDEVGGENTFTRILNALRFIHPGAVLIAMISFIVIKGFDFGKMRGHKIFQFLPGAIVAVISSIVLNEIFKATSQILTVTSDHLVSLPFEGGLKDLASGLRFPDYTAFTNKKVYFVAFTIAIVGSLESLLSIDAADKIDPKSRVTSKNRELIAQGVGNTLSGLIGGLPITAVIVRTSANVIAGGKTKRSAIYHGFLLLVSVMMIPHLLNLIPLSSLASVLIIVGYKLTHPKLYTSMLEKGMDQFIPFIVTILAILFTNLLVGISIGMVVGFIFVLKSSIHNSIVMVQDENMFLIKFYKDVSFLQKSSLLACLDKIPSRSSVVIDGSKGVFVDSDIEDMIEEFVKRSVELNIQVELKKSSLSLSPLFRSK